MKIDLGATFNIDISEPTLKAITQAFFELSRKLIGEFFQTVFERFAEYYMGLEEKPFCCEGCGNRSEFSWKTRRGKGTKLLTIFGVVGLQQLQVRCTLCGRKIYLL